MEKKIGSRFEKLEIVGDAFPVWDEKHNKNRYYVPCRCDCGNTLNVRKDSFGHWKHKSCGCISRKILDANAIPPKHGHSGERLYKIWIGMLARCSRETLDCFHNYGGRGIRVCDEWSQSYEAFRDWALANGYAPGLTIDRKENDGNYEPSNCRWATWKEQSNNKRDTIFLTAWGETKALSYWLDDPRCNVARGTTVTERLARGLSPEDALSVIRVPHPPRPKKPKPVKVTKWKKNPRTVTAWGETKPLHEWAKDGRCSADYHVIYARLYQNKWEPEKAISTPTLHA